MAFEISTYDERPTTNKYPGETLARIMAYPLPFIAISPDFHFFGFFDQVFPEIRMGDADESFSPFPGRSAHKVDHAVFRSDPVDLRPRVRNRRTRCQRRDDARFVAASLFVVERRPQGDDALAAARTISAVREVELAAAAADLMSSG